MIPVTVVTGFLGSGKTTLLRHVLRDPAMARTAVIVNEFGEVGLDHELIETSDESLMQLTSGCLCCRVRSDLVVTLADLVRRRAAGTVTAFERVVIETTGLADPAPILQALMSDSGLVESYGLAGLVATADAVNCLATLSAHGESVRQIALADRIVVTKSDLPQARTTVLEATLDRLNPGAPRVIALRGAVDSGWLLADTARGAGVGAVPEPRSYIPAVKHVAAAGISSFCIVREEPLAAVALTLWLQALAENCGPALLRMKGIVRVTEEPDRPAVLHGVQHVFHPIEWLERWPTSDRRSRLVFIVQGISESWVRRLLEAIESEVEDEMSQSAR